MTLLNRFGFPVVLICLLILASIDAIGAGVNVAAQVNGGVASASSTYSSGYPVGAVNNGDRLGINWASGGGWNDATLNLYPDWVQITFNSQKSIDEIDVYTLQDAYKTPSEPTATMTFASYGVTAFDVQYWNGTGWVTVPGGNISGNTLVWRKISFAAITTDRIRVLVNASLDGYSRITEIEAYSGTGAPNVPPAVSLTSPANGSTYTAPAAITLNAAASDSDGISKVEFYNGDKLLGTDTTSPYSWSLANVSAGSYSYLVKAYDALNASATSAAVSVIVNAPNTPPTVSLTAPATGSTYTALASITLNATASDSNGISKVEFYNGTTLLGTDTSSPYSWSLANVTAGNYSYTAKAFDTLNTSATSAAVTVTVSETNTPPTVSLTAPANGSSYTAPAAITLNATASDNNGISKVEFYNGASLVGTDTSAPYSLALTNVAAGSYSYTARAYDTLNAVSISTAVNVTVSTANTPPAVSLTSPANGATYTAPAAITLNANASDSNGVSKVEFYNGASLLGTDTTAPYSWALTNVAAGSYSYTARAYDTLNAVTTSTAVNVTVSAANVPPVVSLTSPTTGSTYTAPAAITLNATASDSNGIAKVEFYRGTTLLGTDTSAPYSWALTNVDSGSYSYTAKAYDTLNAATTSTTVNVTVSAANVPPVVSLTSPANGSAYTAPAAITLNATASDSNGIAKVEFYRGTTLLGTDTTAPYSWALTNVAAGSYSYTAKAYDSLNATTTSAAVSVTVSAAPVRTETVTYYHTDALGSPVAATDQSGNLVWRETYRPYGERLNNAPAGATNPLWYTGKRQDPETGLVYMGARYYNPMLGRFLSIDPIEPDENNLHSLNRYAYANNNPYKFVDPDGQAAETVIDVVSLGLSINTFRQDPGFINGLAVAYDGFATAIPFLPGGIGIIRQAASKGSEVTQAVKQAADRGAAKAGEGAQKVANEAGRNLPFKDADRLTEVNKTLDRIESGGPYPYKKDGTIFKNKEGRLPEGNYREYTVDTQGASNRGARRVVQETSTGKTYYSDDHYRNFIRIDPVKR